MSDQKPFRLAFQAVYQLDNKTGRYTGFFHEIPHVVAEGSTIKDTKEKLLLNLRESFLFYHYRHSGEPPKGEKPIPGIGSPIVEEINFFHY